MVLVVCGVWCVVSRLVRVCWVLFGADAIVGVGIVHTHAYTHTNIYTITYTHTHIFINTFTHIHAYIHLKSHIHTYTPTFAHANIDARPPECSMPNSDQSVQCSCSFLALFVA